MNWIKINAGDSRYVSDFMQDFAEGVWNKKLADTGGSHMLITNDIPYVMVVPNVDLVKSLIEDGTKYPVFGVYGGIYEQQFLNFKKEYGKVMKIAVTWDSLYKLIDWINPEDYQICVDEYHLIFESIGFRLSAINSMMALLNKFKNVRFISATPNQEQFEFEAIKNLPHYEIEWKNTQKVHPIMHKSNNVVISTCMFISKLLNGELEAPDVNGTATKVEELYIFLNSVKTIEQICNILDLNPSDVKICCSNRKRNKFILDTYEIEDVTAPNKKINFFTSKCFQGCNLYTNNGLVLMVSDTKRPSMMIDMSTQGAQIVGRIRNGVKSNNIFRNTVVFIYTTNKNFTEEELDSTFNATVEKNESVLNDWKTLSDNSKEWIKEHIDENNDFLIVDGDSVYISEDKKQYAKYQNYLRLNYRNDFTIINSFNADKFGEIYSKTWTQWSQQTAKQFSKVKMCTYKEIVTDYFTNEDTEWLNEYPELADYKKYLSLTECNSLHFVKQNLLKRIADKKKVWYIIRDTFNEGEFYAATEVKSLLKAKFKEEDIKLTPKASLLLDCPYMDCEEDRTWKNGKLLRGYMVNGIIRFSL